MPQPDAFPVNVAHGDPIAPVILGVTGILLFAVIGRFIARRIGQPTVVGELCMGILLGNVAWYLGVDLITVLREGARVFDIIAYTLAGVPIVEASTAIFGSPAGDEIARILGQPGGSRILQVAYTVDVFSRYGVIFMLFMVGLESDIYEMRKVGKDALRVAILGVVFPLLLGIAAMEMLLPALSLNSMLFVAATLGATSVGISANVLRELDRHTGREGRTILGAAIGDDVLGLLVLAVISGIVVSGSVNVADMLVVISTSALFLVFAALAGPLIVRISARLMGNLHVVEAKMFTAYLFVMVLAWGATLAGLATIIGAFAAGLVLSDKHFQQYESGSKRFATIRELMMPLEVILVPIFFILIGIQVKLESFTSIPVIVVAAVLIVAAVVGKLASGLGAGKGANRLVIGIGMMPRGEVGLVFAAIGRTLGVIDDALFSAIVLMVIVTTLIAPPLLKVAIRQQVRREARSA